MFVGVPSCVLPFLAPTVVPSLSALAAVLLTLVPLFPLIIFSEFLGTLMFVPVPLTLAEVMEVFIVGMEVLMSTH